MNWDDVAEEWERIPDAAVEGAMIGFVIGIVGGALFLWWTW